MADPAPYPGQLKQGARGPAVVAIQGALHAWGAFRVKDHPGEEGLRLYNPTGDWLKPTTTQLKHFQNLHSIETSGVFGPRTHVAMAKWYTAAGKERLVELAHERKISAYHSILSYWCNRMADKRNDWIYTQGSRRMDLLNRGGDPSLQHNVYGDCSSTSAAMIKLACRHVGLPEPDLGAWPTTYTEIGHGRKVSMLLPQIGDRFHYGANSHVATYMGYGRVFSFGGEPGPASRAWDYRPVYAVRRDVG